MANVIKHTATIHISNNISLTQRKIYNVLLFNAFNHLLDRDYHRITIAQMRSGLNMHSRNTDTLKENFKNLMKTIVEYDIFGKNGSEWRAMPLLAEAAIINNSVCEYAYPPSLRKLLRNPEIYSRLNLDISNKFTGRHGLALWESVSALLGSKRNTSEFTYEINDFRRLMGIQENEYPAFGELNRTVIYPAIKEVNKISDLYITVKKIRRGRSVHSLKFQISRKEPLIDATAALMLNDDENIGDEDGTPLSDNDKVILRFTKMGFEKKQANAFIQKFNQYSSDHFNSILDYVDRQQRNGKVKNLQGYTVRALQHDWRYKESFDEKHVKKTKENNEKRAGESEKRIEIEKQFVSHRINKAKDLFSELDLSKQEKLEQQFKVIINPTLKSFYKLSGLKNPMVSSAFYEFVADEYLNEPVYRDVEVYSASVV